MYLLPIELELYQREGGGGVNEVEAGNSKQTIILF